MTTDDGRRGISALSGEETSRLLGLVREVDSVELKLTVPTELPEDPRRSPAFSVEVDAMPGGYTCSGSLKAKIGPTDLKRTMAGERPLATGRDQPGRNRPERWR